MPPTVRGPARKNQIKTPPPAPVVVTPPPVPTTTTNNKRVRPVRKNTPAPVPTTNNRRTTTVRTKPLAVTQSPQFRQKGIQRSTVSKPVVTPPTISLFKDGPVLKEVGFPSVPIVAPNVFLPPTIVPVRPPPQPTIDTGINSNPLSTNTGGSINQPSIFPGYADTDSVISGGIDDNTTMLIIAAIVCGFIILKKV